MRYVIARINDDLFASEIAKGIEILQAIRWVVDAWKEARVETIKNYLAKCQITEKTSEHEDDIMGEEFNALFNELADSVCDMTAKEYVDFARDQLQYGRLESKFSQTLYDRIS